MHDFIEKSYDDKISILQAHTKVLSDFLFWYEQEAETCSEDAARDLTDSIVRLKNNLIGYDQTPNYEAYQEFFLLRMVREITEKASEYSSLEAHYVKILSEDLIRDSKDLTRSELKTKLATYQETVQGIAPIILLRAWEQISESGDYLQAQKVSIFYPGYKELCTWGNAVVPSSFNPKPLPLDKEGFEVFLGKLPTGKIKVILSRDLEDYNQERTIQSFIRIQDLLKHEAFTAKTNLVKLLDESLACIEK